MVTQPKRRIMGIMGLIGLSLLVFSFVISITGCGKRDEAPAGAGNYYTGPMAKKQGPAQPPEAVK